MRDHIHPPRMSAPSYMVPPTKKMVIRPYLVPLLPTFHGIREFEEVCNILEEETTTVDLMRFEIFPFTLKDNAKFWLNSLRPRSIQNWTKMQAEFLKHFFSTHSTNNLERKISTFSANENEKFYAC